MEDEAEEEEQEKWEQKGSGDPLKSDPDTKTSKQLPSTWFHSLSWLKEGGSRFKS